MSETDADLPGWAIVDEGWGRKAVDFSTSSEPSNCREYVALHHQLGIDVGNRVLDVACGPGLAIELARVRGAGCAGIDASPRLVAIARYRNPDCDIRVGDMHHLPWDHQTFDVVTSFRGIWGTTPDVVLAAAKKVENQAAMVSLGRPGAGERLLESCGFIDIERVAVPFRVGVALRAEINVVGYLARKPEGRG